MRPASTYIFNAPECPEKHRHEHAQLIVGIDGVCNIESEGREATVDKMLGCIIPSQTSHVFSGIGDNRNLTVNFDLRYSSDLTKRICEEPRILKLDQSIQTLLQFAAMELPEFNGSTNIGHNSFCQHVVTVLTHLLGKRIFSHLDYLKRIDLIRIDKYLDERMDQKISVEDLALESSLSSSHFYTLFKQETGVTPHRYIINRKLDKAMLMLRVSSLSISEISYETGFSCQSAFSNNFKKKFGTTPGKILNDFR